jgi:hypothetical protein
MNLLSDPLFQTAACLFFVVFLVTYFGMTGIRRGRNQRARLLRGARATHHRRAQAAQGSARAMRELEEESDIEQATRRARFLHARN